MGRRVYPENAPTIFVHGGCDVIDPLNIELIRAKYRLDSPAFSYNTHIVNFNTSTRFRETSSLESIYSKPGIIAERVYDSLKNVKNLTPAQLILAEDTLKYPVLDFYKNNVKHNDIMVIGFLNEFNLKIRQNHECFNISSRFTEFADTSSPLHWLYTNYIVNEKFHASFIEDRNLQVTKDYIKEYANELYKIFNHRLIILNTHMSNFFYSNTELNVSQMLSTSIPFYRYSKFTQDPIDLSNMRKWVTTFIKAFKHFYPVDVPVVSISNTECFKDPTHRFGHAPTHLHPYTVNKIGIELFAQLEKISAINSTCEDFSKSQLII